MIYEINVTGRSGEGRSFRVEVRRSAEGTVSCVVDGKPLALGVAEAERDVLSLIHEGASYEVRRDAAQAGVETVLQVNGENFRVDVSDPRSFRARKRAADFGDGPRKIKAPMPGKVVRILAEEGTAVESGQGVVVIEAMKMQNELKSPKKGVVSKISAAVGATVNPGDTLAVIE